MSLIFNQPQWGYSHQKQLELCVVGQNQSPELLLGVGEHAMVDGARLVDELMILMVFHNI